MNLYFGIVEDRFDDLKLGRCKVRIMGIHSYSRAELPTSDLPWAHPIQPIISAGVSGIGFAPVGLVEGSWVVVTFNDPDMQIPLILGSIGGIPADSIDAIRKLEPSTELKFKTTEQITTYTSRAEDIIKMFDPFKASATKTEEGFVIGYKSYFISGKIVTEGLTISRDIADSGLKGELNVILESLRSNIRAPITQSMMDALVSMAHDIGIINLLASPILSDLNTAKYDSAAAQILAYPSINQKRRAVEKTQFMKEGIPSLEIEKSVTESSTPSDNAFNSPTGKYPLNRNEPDTNKLARGENLAETYVVFKENAAVSGIPLAGGGSWDQSPVPYAAKYPWNHVMATESGHVMEFDDTPGAERINTFHRSGTYSEIDANGTQVNRIVGDSYEILERNGYVYIRGAHNVTVEGSNNLLVNGVMNVDISGAANINVFNDANINVSGNANMSVGNTLAMKATDILMEADNINIRSNGSLNLQSQEFNIKGSKGAVESSGNLDIKGSVTKVDGQATLDMGTGGILSIGYTAAKFGSGYTAAGSASEAKNSGLASPAATKTASSPTFSTLSVTKRSADGDVNYETPDEGTPEEVQQFIKKRVDSGEVKQKDVEPVKKEAVEKSIKETPPKETPKNTLQAPEPSCDIIFGMQDIPKNLKLSKYYSLNQLTANGSRHPSRGQMGLSPQALVCNLKGLSINCLDVIKEMYPNIQISSGYRRPGDAANSAKNSRHYYGEAADLVFPGFSKKQVWEAAHEIQKAVPYDQLLLEYQGSSTVWIHVTFKYKGNRKQHFTMKNHVRVSDFGKFLLL